MDIRLKNMSGNNIILAVFMMAMLLSLSRFVVNGEPRRVAMDSSAEADAQMALQDDAWADARMALQDDVWADARMALQDDVWADAQTALYDSMTAGTGASVPLYDGVEVQQPVTVTAQMNWRGGHYALKFAETASTCTGTVRFKMTQDGFGEEAAVPVSEIPAGAFYPLPLTMPALGEGGASLSVTTEGVREGELALACGIDYYGFGEACWNGQKTGCALAQEYCWHITDGEYRVRLFCYLLAVAGCIALFILVGGIKGGREETAGRCLAVFGVLTGAFAAMFYIYDSSILLEPTYAEAVTNFMKYAREERFLPNLLISDAGYLPLLPRLITLFFIKVVRIPAAGALYAMQGTACLCCCMVWAFFTLHPFQSWLCLSERILFCFVVMAVCFHTETLFFTNFVYWGVLLILLVMISDMKRWNIVAYAVLVCVCSLVCLSKGGYVVMLPFMAVCLTVFWRSMGGREKVYAFGVMGASLLQALYSFGAGGDGAGWIRSAKDMGQPAYWLRLAARVCADVASSFLAFLGPSAKGMGAALPILTIFVCGAALAGFICKIFRPWIRREKLQPKWRALYALLLFQFAVSAFYRITVKSVPVEWRDVWKAAGAAPGGKYEIFCSTAAFLIWMTLFSIAGEACEMLGTAALALLCILFCPRLQLSGLGGEEISDGRTYAGDIDAGWQQSRELISNSSFFVPVREAFWSYSRNATVYQVGEERFFEESSGVNLGCMEPGYRSFYTLGEDMPAQNLIEVWVRRPNRIQTSPYRAVLSDGQGNILREAVQFTSDRSAKTGFYFPEPVSGVRTIRFVDEQGREVYIDDYICWVSAW